MPVVLHQIDPVAVALGPVSVHWYGLMYFLAFVVAWWLGMRRIGAGRLPGVNEQGFGDLLFYGILGVILGGRIGYVLFYAFSDFIANPLFLFKINEGGMSFHGGLLGVLAAAGYWCYKQGQNFFDVMDFVAPWVPPGLGFGRIGNYIGGELWGKYTQAGWGVIFPKAEPDLVALAGVNGFDAAWQAQIKQLYDSGALTALARHPSQLYQAMLEGLVLFVVLWLFSRKPRRRYAVSGLFALLYGVFRFAVEFVRMPDADIGYLAFGWLTMGQVLSLPLIALGLLLLWLSRTAPVLQPVLPEKAPSTST